VGGELGDPESGSEGPALRPCRTFGAHGCETRVSRPYGRGYALSALRAWQRDSAGHAPRPQNNFFSDSERYGSMQNKSSRILVQEGKIKGSLRFRTKAIFAVILFAGSAAAQEPYYPPPETKGGWRSVVTANGVPTPEQKAKILRTTDLNWDRLQEAWKYCEGFGGPHSLLVIRRGWIAAEWNNFTDPRTIASCTKSLTGLAMAKLFDLSDSGRFPERVRVDDPAYLFMPPSWAEGDPRRKRILLRHLLTMSSGQDPYDGPYEDMNAYAKTVLTVGIEAPPGTVWAYSYAPGSLAARR
jgi:Beta-lactamase